LKENAFFAVLYPYRPVYVQSSPVSPLVAGWLSCNVISFAMKFCLICMKIKLKNYDVIKSNNEMLVSF